MSDDDKGGLRSVRKPPSPAISASVFAELRHVLPNGHVTHGYAKFLQRVVQVSHAMHVESGRVAPED